MFETLNRADHGTSMTAAAFRVSARAQAERSGVERPEGWPEDAGGYTTDLTVIACDEAEARELTVAYLRGLEPGAQLSIDVDVCHTGLLNDFEEFGIAQPVRGVIRVNGSRAYF